MNYRLVGLVASASLVLLSGCGIFGDKDESLEPTELRDFDERIKVRKLWDAKIGGSSEFLLVGLRPFGDGNRIYAASQDGRIAAFEPESGRVIWRVELDRELAAGPTVVDDVLSVVGKNGNVFLLNADDGAVRWDVYVAAESLAAPVITDDMVVVQTIDNRLTALSRFDGKQRWTLEQGAPALTIRGAASPVLAGNNIIAGFDNGRIMAVNAANGDITWDALLSLPTGRSDLDRLSDIDGAMALVGQDLYASGYQGRVAGIAAESGQILWSRDISSQVGVAADWNSLYTAREDGEIVSLSRRTGADNWRNDNLVRREPTLPVPFHTTVVVGDFEGYLHFFSNLDGTTVARVRFGKASISGQPVVVANRLYVQSDKGSIAAYEVIEPEREPRTAPDIAEET